MCVAPTRAEAEDLAAEIEVDFEPLPVVHDMLAGRQPGAPLVHEHWGDNLFLTTTTDVNFEAVKAKAAVSVTRELRTVAPGDVPARGARRGRRSGTRGSASWSCTPRPSSRTSSARASPSASGSTRARSAWSRPMSAAASATRASCCPEEVALAWATRKLGVPLRWLEDRREGLTANANCREHHYMLTAYADADGRLLALDCEATVDSGAYSAYPFSACLEAGQIGSILPGLYDFPHYRCRTYSVATNKPPILPYRGVARTGVCFALEVTLDALARKLGIEPNELRFKSLVRPEQMPFDNIAKRHFDSGDYPEALRQRHRRHRLRQGPRAPAARRAGRPAHRHRLCHVLRAGRPRHQRLCRLGHPVRAGLRAAPGALHAGRRAGAADRRAQPWPGPGDHAVAGGALDPRRAARPHPPRARRHRRDALLHRHLGLALHDHVGRRRGRRLRRAGRARARDRRQACCRPSARRCASRAARWWGRRAASRVAEVARTWYRRPQDLPPDVDPARPGGHRRLQGQARHRHLQLRRARRRRRRRYRDRRAGDPRLRRGRGRRHAGQPDDRRRPDLGRRGAGHRHRALRGDALRRAGPAAGLHALRLPAARPHRGARDPHPAHGDALALHALRPEGHRRGRRHRPARRHHQRRQRCAARASASSCWSRPITPRRIVEAIRGGGAPAAKADAA